MRVSRGLGHSGVNIVWRVGPTHLPTQLSSSSFFLRNSKRMWIIPFDSGFRGAATAPRPDRFASRGAQPHREEVLQYTPTQRPTLSARMARGADERGWLHANRRPYPDHQWRQAGPSTRSAALLLDERRCGRRHRTDLFHRHSDLPQLRRRVHRGRPGRRGHRRRCTRGRARRACHRRRQGAPQLIYNIPEFPNPTGATMPAARPALGRAGRGRGIPIVEDTPLSPRPLRWPRRALR